eukprot:9126787-Alexandrium_andersonii.AAC.1
MAALRFRTPCAPANSQGLRGWRIGGLRIGACDFAAISRPRTPSSPAFIGRCGICPTTLRSTHPSGAFGNQF